MNPLHWLRHLFSSKPDDSRSLTRVDVELLEDRLQPSVMAPPPFAAPVVPGGPAAPDTRPAGADRLGDRKLEITGLLGRDDTDSSASNPEPGNLVLGRPQEDAQVRASTSAPGALPTQDATAAGPRRRVARAVDETLFDFMGVQPLRGIAPVTHEVQAPAQGSAGGSSPDLVNHRPRVAGQPEKKVELPELQSVGLPDHPYIGTIIGDLSSGIEDLMVLCLAQALFLKNSREIVPGRPALAEPDLPLWRGVPARTAITSRGRAFARALERLDTFGDVAAWHVHLAGAATAQLAPPVTIPPAAETVFDNETVERPASELQAALQRALRQVHELEERQARYGQFFSPVIRRALRHSDPELVLSPREAEVTVLFGDLRGFSRQAEKQALAPFLEAVSRALGVMTRRIRDQDGVIGDFHGDATMGFWGWPSAQPDRIARAVRAALGIRALSGEAAAGAGPFHAGIGIASGRAIAGKIGTAEQVKVTVFGPVVNLASRLEGMTKIFGVPVLLDEATARAVRESVPPQEARLRRLAVVLPYGLDRALTVSELLPPARELPSISDKHLAQYERGLRAFLHGDWRAAHRLLADLPRHDRAPEFLMSYMARYDVTAPPNWDGIIRLGSKS